MLVARNNFFTGSPPPPTITSFSPTSLSNGTGTVTINGTNFMPNATTVTVGGTAATSVSVNANLQSLTAAFPSKGRGTYVVRVTTPGGFAEANYTYTVTPSVSSISPSSVYYDYGSGYTIYGSRFSSSGATSVYVSNGGYYGISIANDGQLSFNPGALAAGSYTAQVVAPDGWSNAVGFSSSWYPAPSISSVSDGRGGNGSIPGSTITLSGSNFTGASVSIGGTAVSASVSATSISFSCPSFGSDGTRTITVTTARSGNQSASTSVYTWTAKGATSATYTSGSGSYSIPGWANFVDIVCMGGGGGGGGASSINWGKGGNGGAYGTGTFTRSTSWGTTSISYSVGGGGAGRAANTASPGGSGGTSSAGGVSGGGGAGGCSMCSPMNTTGMIQASAITYNGVSYPGNAFGGNGNSAQPNSNPGSGGGGGNSGFGPFVGIAGRAGAVYFRAYQ